MSDITPIVPLILLVIVLAVVSAGCSTSSPSQVSPGNGTLHVSSVPAGAEVYFDGEYWSTTPALISPVPAGHHTLEFRMSGYESVTYPVTVVKGGMEGITLMLVSEQTLLQSPSNATTPSTGLPHINVNGYWTYPQGFNSTANPNRWNSTTFPVPLVLHTEAINAGTADAREVTASANVYYEGHRVCRDLIDLGTLAAGGNMTTRITPVTCTLPSGYIEPNLVVLVENITVTQ
jgi:hypothetical protein